MKKKMEVTLPEYSTCMCVLCVCRWVCVGEGVYIKQIICTCCGGDPPARVWTSQ